MSGFPRVSIAVAALLLTAGSAHADLVTGSHLGVMLGETANTGDLASRYQISSYPPLLGVEAGIDHNWLELLWSLTWSDFVTSSDKNVDLTLNSFELDFGFRGRVHPFADLPLYVFGQATVNMIRYSIPVDDAGDRNFVGPGAGGGVEVAIGQLSLGLGCTAGLVANGPTAVKLFLLVELNGVP